MSDQLEKAVRSEILKFGPSPYYPNDDRPIIALFHNEMEDTVGIVETDIFGQVAAVFLLITTFRMILYKYNKKKDDEVYSFWFNIDLTEDPFHDPEGFQIVRIETTLPVYGFDDSLQRPFFTWKSVYYNSENVKKEVANIKIFPTKYHYHQKREFVDVLKPISIPGFKYEDKDTYLGIIPFTVKFFSVRRGPMGTLKMVDLMLLHKSPDFASFHEAGEVPEECKLHESKATRARESIKVKTRAKAGTSDKIQKKKEQRSSEVKDRKKKREAAVESGETSPEAKKKKDSWKQVASTALDVGSKLKGGWDVFSKAASAAASTTAGSIKDLAEKTVDSAEKTGKTIKDSIEKTVSDGSKIPVKPANICIACGSPLRAGALFCGKCGQEVVEKIKDEVKDQIQGKIEDSAVEKAKELLKEDSQPKDDKAMREVMIKDSGLPKNIVTSLESGGFKTMGELADRLKEDKDSLSTIKGIGPAAIKKIKQAVRNIPAKKSRDTKSAGKKCVKCGKDLHPDWVFCPYCQEPVDLICKKCGNIVQPDWNFCPMCKAKLDS